MNLQESINTVTQIQRNSGKISEKNIPKLLCKQSQCNNTKTNVLKKVPKSLRASEILFKISDNKFLFNICVT